MAILTRSARQPHPLANVETISPAHHSTRAPPPPAPQFSSPSTAYSESLPIEDAVDEEATQGDEEHSAEEEELVEEDEQSSEEEMDGVEGTDEDVIILEEDEYDDDEAVLPPHDAVIADNVEEEGVEEELEDEELDAESDESEDDLSDGERAALDFEMSELNRSVPALHNNYQLVDRLGEGTFSSVYKALDLNHDIYDNTLWATPHALMPRNDAGEYISDLAPETPQLARLRQQQATGKVYVAVKRIYVTSSPERIQNELDILNDLRGAANVAYLIAAMRHEDQVLAVMPFNRHQDFRTYYRTTSLPMLRSYFSSLLRGLACTHELQIIHRDVKPANFLYDTTSGTGVLCDYGLAEKIGQGLAWEVWKSECCHSFPGPSWGGPKGRAKATRRLGQLQPGQPPGLAAGLHGARLIRPIPLCDQLKAMKSEWKEVRAKFGHITSVLDRTTLDRLRPVYPIAEIVEALEQKAVEMAPWYKSWRSALSTHKPTSGPVGYLEEDRRPHVRANRAGTRGFRAPEVLFKCPDQNVSLDMWSVGIILLCFLTKRFPFFNSNDDTEALAEIAAIFGRRKLEKAAALHNRTFQTNVSTFNEPKFSNLSELCVELNPALLDLPPQELAAAIDLMQRCLEVDLTKRGTAEELLEHEFFDGVYDLGRGVLGERQKWHGKVW